jgi:hypothetical protein
MERDRQPDLLARLEQILHTRIEEMDVCAEFAKPLATPVAVMHQHVAKLRIRSISARPRIDDTEWNEAIRVPSGKTPYRLVRHASDEVFGRTETENATLLDAKSVIMGYELLGTAERLLKGTHLRQRIFRAVGMDVDVLHIFVRI